MNLLLLQYVFTWKREREKVNNKTNILEGKKVYVKKKEKQ